MTISASEIAAQVLARLNADTGSGGLFNASPLVSAAYWDQAPESATHPYIVFDVMLTGASGEAFTANGVSAEIRVGVVCQRWMTGAVNALDTMSAINARVYGDSGAHSGVPGFGLHRWTMSGVTGWNATAARFVSQTSQGDEDRVVMETIFRIESINQTW